MAIYLPLYLNPFFSQTQSYLGTRLGSLGSEVGTAGSVENGLPRDHQIDPSGSEDLGQGRVDLTIGSALDIFGGSGVTYAECVAWNRRPA